MPNLVEELTPNYFNEFFTGALFLRDDVLLQVENAGRYNTTARNYEQGGRVEIPNSFFTGYKIFEYPILGYRKLDEHRVAYLTRRQATARGVRPGTIHMDLSPASVQLRDLGAVPPIGASRSESSKAIAAFRPRFDSISDIPGLLAGQQLALVLSPSIMIEPSVDALSDWYSVYYKQSVIGKINSRGAITWTSPAFASLLPELG